MELEYKITTTYLTSVEVPKGLGWSVVTMSPTNQKGVSQHILWSRPVRNQLAIAKFIVDSALDKWKDYALKTLTCSHTGEWSLAQEYHKGQPIAWHAQHPIAGEFSHGSKMKLIRLIAYQLLLEGQEVILHFDRDLKVTLDMDDYDGD